MVMIQTEEINQYVKKMSTLRKNIIKLYSRIWGHCSSALQSELEGDPEYITKSLAYYCLWLLTKVKIYTSGIDHTSIGYYYAVMAMRTIFYLRQGRDEPTESYYRLFEADISTDELENFNATTHMELNKAYTGGEDEDGTKRFQSICLIMSADSGRYSGIWNDLKNITLLGTYNYPKTTAAAYDVLCCYKKPAPPRQVHAPPAAVIFVQSDDTNKNNTTPGNYGGSFPEVTCCLCQETGHYAGSCPSSTANTCTGTQSLQVDLTMTQTTK